MAYVQANTSPVWPLTCQDVDIFLPPQVLAKKQPEHLRPRDRRIVKALNAPVTAAIFSAA
jgi:hypothetical protein